MKTCLILMLFLTFSQINAQELKASAVPDPVRKEFAKKYPDMYVYEWEWKRKKGLYKAEFATSGSEYEAYFSPDGKWILTERDISFQQIPQKIIDAIKSSEFSDWKIDDVKEINTPEHSLKYQIEMEKGKSEVYLYFLSDGTRLKQ
jgi:hypothetical protein